MDIGFVESIIKLLTAIISFILVAKSLFKCQDRQKPPKG